ncbi:alpha/beta hydrolase [Persicobacter diffluens]
MRKLLYFFSFLTLMACQGPKVYNISALEQQVEVASPGLMAIMNPPDLLHEVGQARLWYYPAGGVNLPAVLICPGGGYGKLAIEKEGRQVAKWCNSLGLSAFVLEYRLPVAPFDHPQLAPVEDGQFALKWLKEQGSNLGLNTEKIGVIGFSAGGHLSACLSSPLEAGQPAPDFSILVYPVISMEDAITHKGSRWHLLGANPTKKLLKQYSAEKRVSERTPKTFLVHAQDDKAVISKNSDLYMEACENQGVDVEYFEMQSGGHGFGMQENDFGEDWTTFVRIWLMEQEII